MFDGGYDSHNPFPHDGEGGRSCTGYGSIITKIDESDFIVGIGGG